MKPIYCVLFLMMKGALFAQFIDVNHLAFSDQLLIEEVLFDNSTCVEDVEVTSTVSGNFPDGMKSYGYFTAPANADFPFSSGIVLSTGRLDHTEGPNSFLSDDDATGWGGDQDLRNALNIPPNEVLINATSIQFNFTPKASQLRFQYIFASEEYQENNSNTCIFSDVFAFLIRPLGSDTYQNIAVVPETNIPVKVTTVRPEIPSACPAENEEWFGQFNQSNGAAAVSPTNFNGQTKVLTAVANVVPDQVYEVKLVIADETNYRYDSAVFINGGSFEVGVNLGLDRIGDSAICEGDEVMLDVSQDNPLNVNWFYNGNLVAQDQNNLLVSEANLGAGSYAVEVVLPNGCIATDEINMEFQSNPQPAPFTLVTCGTDHQDAFSFNLLQLEEEASSLPNNFSIQAFYALENEAENQINAIANPENFIPINGNENVFVLLENTGGCTLIVPITLENNALEYEPIRLSECPSIEESELSFNSNQLRNTIANSIEEQVASIVLFPSRSDALQNTNPILADNFFIDVEDLPTTYYARLQNPAECQGLVAIEFNRTERPEFGVTNTDLIRCREDEWIVLDPQVIAENATIDYLWSTGETTPTIQVSEAGTYTLIATQNNGNNNEVASCSNAIEFTVEVAGIEEVNFQILGQPNQIQSVVVEVIPPGNYQYALNNTAFQSSSSFAINEVENTIYVRDEEGCGIVSRSFYVVFLPTFFTPNSDGVNDVWRPLGLRNEDFKTNRVQIFDRFGKLMISFGTGGFWDGTYQGKPMPPNDYWYHVQLIDGRIFTGNLTLKR